MERCNICLPNLAILLEMMTSRFIHFPVNNMISLSFFILNYILLADNSKYVPQCICKSQNRNLKESFFSSTILGINLCGKFLYSLRCFARSLFIYLFWDRDLHSQGWAWTVYIAGDSFKYLILLSVHPRFWDYRYGLLPCFTQCRNQILDPVQDRQAIYQLSHITGPIDFF